MGERKFREIKENFARVQLSFDSGVKRFMGKMVETKEEIEEFEGNNGKELFPKINKSFDWLILIIIIGRDENVCKKIFQKKVIIKMNFQKGIL